jgi:hypothetical protein
VNRAIEELVPVIAQAPAEHFRRAEWLQRLWQAYTTDSIKREDNAMEFTTKHTTAPALSHVEAIYRPGDRELVIDLFEALGCKTYDTGTKSPAGSTYISVHPDPDVRCQDDVIYLSEMPAEQRRLEDVLRRRIEADEELRAARDLYRGMANERPFGLSHVAVRYPSFESLERVLDGLEDRLTPQLKSRVMLKIFRPGDSDEIGVDNSIQAFVYTDLAVSGISAFGQVFELAAYE